MGTRIGIGVRLQRRRLALAGTAVPVAAIQAPPVTYRFDTIQHLREFATFTEGSSLGAWEIIGSGSTDSGGTGPGDNSGGPYAATDASGGTFTHIRNNSIFNLDMEASWPAAVGRVLRLRCAVAGDFDDDATEGLVVQGMASGGNWEDITLIRGWAHSDGYDAGDEIDDYGGTTLTCAQNGGWVDFDVAIPDAHEQVRLRLEASGGPGFNHDIALWSAELRNI